MSKPRLLVFASGTAEGGSSQATPLGFSKTDYRQENLGGGSGFENLATSKELDADIVAVVSDHEHGGVRERADRLGIPFIYFPEPFDRDGYSSILQKTRTEWAALSGWMKKVAGLDPARTFNIHPALLSFDHGRFGGKGMHGHHIHEAVQAALEAGEIRGSGFSMHFVTDELDGGPVFFEQVVPLRKGMTSEEIQKAVNVVEHQWQPRITDLVVHGEIWWDGKDPASLVVPEVHEHLSWEAKTSV